MRIISFNVNGIRATIKKLKTGEKTGSPTNNSLISLIGEYDPDILCLQEIKTSNASDLDFLKPHFPFIYTNHSTIKAGYSGVALLSKEEPLRVTNGFDRVSNALIGNCDDYEFNQEGRLITAEFEEFVAVTSYTPNAKAGLTRIDDRLKWERILRNYLWALETRTKKPIILCGDLNVAHQEIDIHNPKSNKDSPGFSKQERDEFTKMLSSGCGFTDSFRFLHHDVVKYSYWSNFRNSRERNLGWRIDYILVSSNFSDKIVGADCLDEFHGSDHGPVLCDIDI